MNIDPGYRLTPSFLSHGHDDHTRGLKSLLELKNAEAIQLIAHPHALNYKECDGLKISAPFTRMELAEKAS